MIRGLSCLRYRYAWEGKKKESEDDKDVGKILEEWAYSEDMWLQRVSVLSTFPFVRAGFYDHTLTVSTILLNSTHDLIQKAVGWLLREVGKGDKSVLLEFLRRNDNYKIMPRTMLRYSIEHITGETHNRILKGMSF